MKLLSDSYLNRFKLDSFVLGESNRNAVEAAMAFISESKFSFDLFYLSGPPGCGKTHLAGAIGNELLLRHKNMTILTFSGDRIHEMPLTMPNCTALIIDSADVAIIHYPDMLTRIVDHCLDQKIVLIMTAVDKCPGYLLQRFASQIRTADIGTPDDFHLEKIAVAISVSMPLLTSSDLAEAVASASSIRHLETNLHRLKIERELSKHK